MALCLVHKHGGLDLDSQHSHKGWNSSIVEARAWRIAGAGWPSAQVQGPVRPLSQRSKLESDCVGHSRSSSGLLVSV